MTTATATAIKLQPGMVLGGNPFLFLPGNVSQVGEGTYRGCYNEGELPAAEYVEYSVALEKLPSGNEDFLSLYKVTAVMATSASVLRSAGGANRPCSIEVDSAFVVSR